MKFRWAALGLVLALSAFVADSAAAQGSGPGRQGRGPGPLGQNFPNPFNPETSIPFSVGMEGDPAACLDPAKTYRVSLRIHNVLAQVVAIPILQGGGEQRGRPIHNLQLTCGEFVGWWDGKVAGGREAASGVYAYQLEIDGRVIASRKMSIVK